MLDARHRRAGGGGSTGWWHGGSCSRWAWPRRRDRRRGCDAGGLHRLHPGVYAVGHRVDLAGGALDGGGSRSAGRMPCSAIARRRRCGGSGSRRARAIEVTAPTKSRSRGGIQRHFALLPGGRGDRREHGIPVTTVPRTLFDLAGRPPPSTRSSTRCASPNTCGCTTGSRCRTCSSAIRGGGARRRSASACAVAARLPAGALAAGSRREFLPFLRRNGCRGPGSTPGSQVGGRSIPGRLPLAAPARGRRARRVRGARHPGRLPRGPGAGPAAAGRRLWRHPDRAGAARRRTRGDRRRSSPSCCATASPVRRASRSLEC